MSARRGKPDLETARAEVRKWTRAELAAGPPVLWTTEGRNLTTHVFCVHRKGELKRGTVGYVCRGPQPATVGFNDRTADRQPQPQTARLRRVEGVEDVNRQAIGTPNRRPKGTPLRMWKHRPALRSGAAGGGAESRSGELSAGVRVVEVRLG